MGEIADDHFDRLFDDEWDDDCGLFLGHRYLPYRPSFDRVCSRCGARGLKWRETDAGWRLFENERIKHNRLELHECNPISDDDFDVIET